MFRRLLAASLLLQPLHSVLVAGMAALAALTLTALLSVTLPIEDELQRALRGFGASLSIEPAVDGAGQPRLLLADLARVQGILWRDRLEGVAPLTTCTALLAGGREVPVSGAHWRAPASPSGAGAPPEGLPAVWPDARLTGRWPAPGEAGAVAGADLARELGLRRGGRLAVLLGPDRRPMAFTLTGVLDRSGPAGAGLWLNLEELNAALGRPGTADRVLVAALTSPEVRGADFDPRRLSAGEFDRWYCRPTVSSVSYQLERAWPGARVRVARRVAEAGGELVRRARSVLWTLAALALAVLGLAMGVVRRASLARRRSDVGLLRALGAGDGAIARLFLAEAAALGAAGFAVGAPVGFLWARHVAGVVFGVGIGWSWVVVPVGLGVTAGLACAGSWAALRGALRAAPAEVLGW